MRSMPFPSCKPFGMSPRTRAIPYWAAPLLRHVAHVVLVRPEEEVAWSNTGWVVAVMADIQVLPWDRPIHQLVGDAGCGLRSSFKKKAAILPVISIRRPDPALPRFIHFAPESLRNALNGAHPKGVSVRPPHLVVRIAPPAMGHGPRAVIDGAIGHLTRGSTGDAVRILRP